MKLAQSYQYCENIAKLHYENFPVASKFLPKKLRQPISVIYAFARTADDFADEGNLRPEKRIQLLEQYHQQLDLIDNTINNTTNQPDKEIFIALADVIKKFNLPISLFHQLLEAFEFDINMSSENLIFTTHSDLLDYCKKSANTIGRLMLHLHNKESEQNYYLSDQICTALQLINFIQDLQQDANESQRLYISNEDIHNLEIDSSCLIKNINEGNQFTNKENLLISQQINYAEQLLQQGQPLIKNLSGRFKFEISLIVNSGFKILHKLKQNQTFSDRPRLTKWDKLAILVNSFKSAV